MIQSIKQAVLDGALKEIESMVGAQLDAGVSPTEILDSMTVAMDEIGDAFQRDEIFVPEMMISAKTMQRGVAVLRPVLTADSVGRYGKFIIGTVAGDMHDIGKNLVALMIEAAGFEVIDLGVSVSTDAFVEAVKANPDCRLVGLSAMLTTTMTAMRNTVAALREVRPELKIMIGGAPITQLFADEIGADVYTADAGSAAAGAKALAG